MIVPVLFAGAAALGATVRASLAAAASDRLRIPVATLGVNLAGAFLLGAISSWDAPAATVVGTAGLGALTTFSTLAGELEDLWVRDRPAFAAYLVASLAGGIALALAGTALA